MARYHQGTSSRHEAATPLAEVRDDRVDGGGDLDPLHHGRQGCALAPREQTILQAARGAGVRIGAAC